MRDRINRVNVSIREISVKGSVSLGLKLYKNKNGKEIVRVFGLTFLLLTLVTQDLRGQQ